LSPPQLRGVKPEFFWPRLRWLGSRLLLFRTQDRRRMRLSGEVLLFFIFVFPPLPPGYERKASLWTFFLISSEAFSFSNILVVLRFRRPPSLFLFFPFPCSVGFCFFVPREKSSDRMQHNGPALFSLSVWQPPPRIHQLWGD